MRTGDLPPTPKALRRPPVPAELLAEVDPELAALVADWEKALERVAAAQRDYEGVLPPTQLGRTGHVLQAALDEMARAVADGGETDADELAGPLADLLGQRPWRLARLYAAVALADAAGERVVARAELARAVVARRLEQLEAEALGELAPLRRDDADSVAAVLVLARVRVACREHWAPLAALAEWLDGPRSPRTGPAREMPAAVEARVRELTGKPPLEPAGGYLVGVEGSSEWESAAAKLLGVRQPLRVAQRPGRR